MVTVQFLKLQQKRVQKICLFSRESELTSGKAQLKGVTLEVFIGPAKQSKSCLKQIKGDGPASEDAHGSTFEPLKNVC